jgi:3-hydroxyacyl-[acyl-carrier-protein] dehydratase
MKFILIDKIKALETNEQIITVKNVSMAEEYLADHFPAFPVLPGVLLLEGLIESAAWLTRDTQNFQYSMVLLESAKNVKYKSFAAPGMKIEYNIEAKTIAENISSFTGVGSCGDENIVEAKLSLRHFNLADENPKLAANDAKIIESLKQRWNLLRQ